MLELFRKWYHRRFSDPEVIVLLTILLIGSGILYFFYRIFTPFLVAIVLAYLLDWPTKKLMKWGLSRLYATIFVVLLALGSAIMMFLVITPMVWQQSINFIRDSPKLLTQFYNLLRELPERYSSHVDAEFIDAIINGLRVKLMAMGETVVRFSLESLVNVFSIAVYAVLVPMMVFFLLKDKTHFQRMLLKILPKELGLASHVGREMNQKVINYIRGKIVEIVIMTVSTYILFLFFPLPYSLVLALLVGLSTIIPYVGVFLVTILVAAVGISHWGAGGTFWLFFSLYFVLQFLDANILVPLLFSEVVDIHPLSIILAVLIFGNLWGFWGVFFAIPLATLLKTVLTTWPEKPDKQDVIV